MVLLSNVKEMIMYSSVQTMVNVNAATGIAYGYINANNVNGDVLHEIFCNGIDSRRLECDIEFAAKHGFVTPEQEENEVFSNYLARVQDVMLDFLNNLQDEEGNDLTELVEEHDRQYEEFTGDIHVATIDDTTVIYNTESNTICVMDSKNVGKYFLCSPCCPNAGDLDSAGGDVETYDVPANWREMDY